MAIKDPPFNKGALSKGCRESAVPHQALLDQAPTQLLQHHLLESSVRWDGQGIVVLAPVSPSHHLPTAAFSVKSQIGNILGFAGSHTISVAFSIL